MNCSSSTLKDIDAIPVDDTFPGAANESRPGLPRVFLGSSPGDLSHYLWGIEPPAMVRLDCYSSRTYPFHNLRAVNPLVRPASIANTSPTNIAPERVLSGAILVGDNLGGVGRLSVAYSVVFGGRLVIEYLSK